MIIRSPYTPYSIYLSGTIGFRVQGSGLGFPDKDEMETGSILRFQGIRLQKSKIPFRGSLKKGLYCLGVYMGVPH